LKINYYFFLFEDNFKKKLQKLNSFKKFVAKSFCIIFALLFKDLVAQLVEHSDFIGRVLDKEKIW
jgi:hypothetical protein